MVLSMTTTMYLSLNEKPHRMNVPEHFMNLYYCINFKIFAKDNFR